MPAFKSPRTLRILQAGAILAAVGTGYAVRDIKVVDAQGTTTAPPPQQKPVVQTPATRDAAITQNAFVAVAENVEPAVVTIETIGARETGPTRGQRGPGGPGGPGGNSEQDFKDFFKQFQKQFGFGDQSFQPNSWQGRVLRDKAEVAFQQVQSRRGGGLGSGMIYRADGLIITNAHVVKGADTVTVTLSDGTKDTKAKVLGRDERTDIAVVKMKTDKALPTVKLGDSDEVRSGQWAIAVGNPFGLDHTLTVGVISATNRNGNRLRLGGEDTRTDYIQTDASINPGNSGGPLLDIYGRVIGVNNAIYSESGGNQGIGFAIPVNTARSVADKIARDGKVRRGYLGVQIDDAKRYSAAMGLDPDLEGVFVAAITDPNTPGAKAGLKAGDVIVKFNGEEVKESGQLQAAVGNSPVGSAVTLTVIRDGNPVQLKATLEELPDLKSSSRAQSAPDKDDAGPAKQGGTALPIPGLKARDLNAAVARNLGVKQTKGIVLSEVADDSPAADAGLKTGDVVTKVGQKPVNTVAEMQTEITRILNGQTGDQKQVALRISRDGEENYVIITLE